jgi:hypothetical protein
MKCIIYTRQDGGVSVVYPAPEFEDNIEFVADKDVPSGIYYQILNISELPTEPQETWELVIANSNADGKGLTKEEFEVKYPEYKGMAVQ